MSESSLADMAEILITAKAAKDAAEEALKNANAEIKRLEEKLWEQMQAEEIDKFSAHGKLFFPIVQQNPSVNKEHEAEFFEWLEEKGEEGVIKRTIHPQTLKAWYKTNADTYAEELSEKNYLSVFEQVRIGVRSGK